MELLLHAFTGLAAAWLVYLLLEQLNEARRSASLVYSESDTPVADITLNIPTRTFLMLRFLFAVVVFIIVGAALGAFAGVLCALAAFFGPLFYVSNLRHKRVRKIETQLVDALELLGNSLRSGLTLQQSVELVVKEFPNPIRQEFAVVLSETRLGVEFTDALRNMGERLRSNIVQVLATGVMVTKRCGGDLTVIFANIAATIRELATIEGKLNAVTAQGRFQGLILGMMPFALIILLYFVDRTHVETLFGYTIGRWAVGGVVVMVMMAQLWIRKLLAIDV